jgi:hypothetical protein
MLRPSHPHPFISTGIEIGAPAPKETRVKNDAGQARRSCCVAILSKDLENECRKKRGLWIGTKGTEEMKNEIIELEKNERVSKDNILTFNIVRKKEGRED